MTVVTQSIKAQTANIRGNSKQNIHVKDNPSGSSFERIMDSSMDRKRDASNQVANQRTSNNSKKEDAFAAKSALKSDSPAKTEKNGTEISKKVVKDAKEEVIEDGKHDITTDSKLRNEIMELLNSIQQVVMEILNRSTEELQQLMAEQGMTFADLQNPDMLRQLVLADSGQTGITAVLTDETLAASMKELLQTVEELTADTNLDFTDEQVKNIIDQLNNSVDMNVDSKGDQDTVAQGIVQGQDITPEMNLVQGNSSHPGKGDPEDETGLKKQMNESNRKIDGKDLETSKAYIATETEQKAMLSQAREDSSGALSDQSDSQPEYKPVDNVSEFVDHMMDVTQMKLPTDMEGNTIQQTEIRDIANQIIEQIRVVVRQDQTSMELQLNPENLGKVNLSIQSKDGVMTAQFVVQNELTKEAIESQIVTLRDTIEQQGLKVETIEVTVANYGYEQSNQADSQKEHGQQKSATGRKITMEEAIQMGDLAQEDTTIVDVTGIRGSQIDYTA